MRVPAPQAHNQRLRTTKRFERHIRNGTWQQPSCAHLLKGDLLLLCRWRQRQRLRQERLRPSTEAAAGLPQAAAAQCVQAATGAALWGAAAAQPPAAEATQATAAQALPGGLARRRCVILQVQSAEAVGDMVKRHSSTGMAASVSQPLKP